MTTWVLFFKLAIPIVATNQSFNLNAKDEWVDSHFTFGEFRTCIGEGLKMYDGHLVSEFKCEKVKQ